MEIASRPAPWKQIGESEWELLFEYKAKHRYRNESESGTARIERSLHITIHNSSGTPAYKKNRLRFPIQLRAHETWHVCLNFVPKIEGKTLNPVYRCESFAAVEDPEQPAEIFLAEAASFASADTETLAPVVTATLAQARRDLASLRLDDLDHGMSAWTMAAGLPVYTALFGRDTLTASWQAAMLGTGMMEGGNSGRAGCVRRQRSQ